MTSATHGVPSATPSSIVCPAALTARWAAASSPALRAVHETDAGERRDAGERLGQQCDLNVAQYSAQRAHEPAAELRAGPFAAGRHEYAQGTSQASATEHSDAVAARPDVSQSPRRTSRLWCPYGVGASIGDKQARPIVLA